MKHLFFVCTLVFAGLSVGASLSFAGDSHAANNAKRKIVFHVNFDGEDRFNDVVSAVENTQRSFGKENVEIVVVAHSAGAGLVTKANAERAKRIESLTASGARFGICKFTAAGRNIADSDLVPGVTKVEGGIPEVVRLQEQGYLYIKLY